MQASSKSTPTLILKKPELFSFNETLWFLDRNLDDCMHQVKASTVRKLISNNGSPVLLEVSEKEDQIIVRPLLGKIRDEDQVLEYIKEWFDMDRDIRPFYKLLRQDAELSPLANNFRGFHMVGIPDLFETLCWCVIGQQINLEFAYKVKRRLVEQFGTSIVYKKERFFLFPEPGVLAGLSIEKLKTLQLTTRKAEYIKTIAELFLNGELSKEKLLALGSEERMMDRLLEVRGIGEWTANYALMKSLRCMNRVPYGDAGIHIALNRLKSIPKKNNRRQVEEVFERFPGWKSYLVYYLWRSLRLMA